MRRLIIFLIRKRLGLKREEEFRFANQKSEYDYYFFSKNDLLKVCFIPYDEKWHIEQSTCSLNWLLDDNCNIIKLKQV